MKSRSVRTLAVLASAGLLVGAFAAGPAEAAKKKKKPKPASCAPATAAGNAAEVEFIRLTESATADAPVEVALETAEGLGFSSSDPDGAGDDGHTSHVYQNLQVISKKPGATLFVAAEFAEHQDYDLFFRDAATQETLAFAAGFNQMPGYLDGGEGGHSDHGLEQIDAFPYEGCAGYTVDVVSAITEGGEVTLKLWLE